MRTKIITAIPLISLCLLIPTARASQDAQVQVFNTSIRMNPGKCDCGGGFDFYLHFSTYYTEDVQQANGEISPLPQPAPTTHWSWMILEDISMTTATTLMKLNLPVTLDSNGDGLPDFFDIAQGVTIATTGTYADIWGLGRENPLTATWSRTPGTRQGSCEIRLQNPMLGNLGPFRHTFEIIHYAGTLAYTPGANTVSGTLQVTQSGNPGSQIQGSVQFAKSPATPHDVLTLQDGSWTRTDYGPLAFVGGTFTRSASRPKTYSGTVQCLDGYYRSWTLSIQDANDANQNGIPDFSDDPTVSPPRTPRLALTQAAGGLQLTIAGDVGRIHRIQEALVPGATEWTTVQTLTLTNDPQVVTLPLPTVAPRFWRVKAE